MLELTELSKTYGKVTALKNVSLTVGQGETVAFVGPEGSGKSTIFRIATALTPPSEGHVAIEGKRVDEDSVITRNLIGFLPQSNPLYSEMLLYDYLRYVARLRSVPRRDVRGSIRAVCELTGLMGELNAVVGDLSPPNRRLVGVAQALVGDPLLLFIDAPFEGLSEEEVEVVAPRLNLVAKRFTMCVATENLSTATRLCSRLVMLQKGQVVADGTAESMLEQESNIGRYIMVVKGAKAEEFADVVKKVPGVTDTDRVTTQKQDAICLEVTATADRSVKQQLKDAVAAQEGWELARIGRKTLDLHSIYNRLTGS